MAVRHQLILRKPGVVWSLLEDETRYGDWVVGTHETGPGEGRWPEVGSTIDYTVRLGPKEFQGHTTVRGIDRPGALELEADNGPLGTARISFDIRPWGDNTLVIVDEHPLRGPGGQFHNAALDALLQIRHRTMLGRLAKVVEDMPPDADRP